MSQPHPTEQDIQDAILKTLAYFDVAGYPLTQLELWRWLYLPGFTGCSLAQLVAALRGPGLSEKIDHSSGYYFLKGRQEIVERRFQRYILAKRKYAIALRSARWLPALPFIEMVAVCNTLAYSNTAAQSDIDIFIVVRRGRLWLTRLVVTLLMTMLGVRRHGRHVANRLCLSFYVADNHLDLRDIALPDQDPYLLYWLATLAPVYNRDDMYRKLLAANPQFLETLPNFFPTQLSDRRRVRSERWLAALTVFNERLLSSRLGTWFERYARRFQLEKMNRNTQSVSRQNNSNVVINDTMLKFHEQDRRLEYRRHWEEKLEALKEGV